MLLAVESVGFLFVPAIMLPAVVGMIIIGNATKSVEEIGNRRFGT